MGAGKSKHIHESGEKRNQLREKGRAHPGRRGVAREIPVQERRSGETRRSASGEEERKHDSAHSHRPGASHWRKVGQRWEEEQSSEIMRQILPYLPLYCVDWISQAVMQKEELSSRTLEKTVLVLICDISGFSKMNEALDRGDDEQSDSELEQRSGPERVKEATSAFFERLISAIIGAGGDVATVAGDAIFAFFDVNEGELELIAPRVSSCVRTIARELNGYRLDDGQSVELGVHSSLAYGDIAINFVGGRHDSWLQVPVGPAIVTCAEGVEVANQGEVVATHSVAQSLPMHHIDTSHESSRFVKLTPPEPGEKDHGGDWNSSGEYFSRVSTIASRTDDNYTVSLAQSFLPDPVVYAIEQGVPVTSEIRKLTVLFLRAEPPSGSTLAVLGALQSIADKCQEIISFRAGMIKELSHDDKGLVCVAAFGLDSAHEGAHDSPAAAACKAARSLQSIMPAGGISTGQCFMGPLGTDQRKEFGMAGVTMVTAARLMSKASKSSDEKGLVLVDEATKQLASEELMFKHCGEVSVKGLRKAVNAYKPRRRVMPSQSAKASSPTNSLGTSQRSPLSSLHWSGNSSPLAASNSEEDLSALHEEHSTSFLSLRRLPDSVWAGWAEHVDTITKNARDNGRSRAILIEGQPKCGKSSFLERCMDTLQTMGFFVVSTSFLRGGEPNDYGLHPSWFNLLSDLRERAEKEVGIAHFTQEFQMAQLVSGFRANNPSIPSEMERCVQLSSESFIVSLGRGLRDAIGAISERKPVGVCLDNVHALSAEGWQAINMMMEKQPLSTVALLASSTAVTISERKLQCMRQVRKRCDNLELTGLSLEQMQAMLPLVMRSKDGSEVTLSEEAIAFLAERSNCLLGPASLIASSVIEHELFEMRDGRWDIVDKKELWRLPIPKAVQAKMLEYTFALPVRHLFYLRLASVIGTIDEHTAILFATFSNRSATLEEAKLALECIWRGGLFGLMSNDTIPLCHLAMQAVGTSPSDREKQRVFVVKGSLYQHLLLRSMSNEQRNQLFAKIVDLLKGQTVWREFGVAKTSDEEWLSFVSKAQNLESYSSQVIQQAGTIDSRRARMAALVTLRLQLDSSLDRGGGFAEPPAEGPSNVFEETGVSKEECWAVAVNDTVCRFGRSHFAGRSGAWLKGYILLLPLFRAIDWGESEP